MSQMFADVIRPKPLHPEIEETPHFSKKELSKLYAEFRRISNKNNVLDMDGFRQALGVLGWVEDSLLCRRLFSVFNKSGSGFVTFEEYALGLGVLMKGSVDERLDFAFNLADLDNSGSITPSELEITIESIMRIYAGVMGSGPVNTKAQGFKFNVEAIKRVFRKLDKNNDGKISRDEYKAGLKEQPELIGLLRGSQKLQTEERMKLEKAEKLLHCYRRLCKGLEVGVTQAIFLAEQIPVQTNSKFNVDAGSSSHSQIDSMSISATGTLKGVIPLAIGIGRKHSFLNDLLAPNHSEAQKQNADALPTLFSFARTHAKRWFSYTEHNEIEARTGIGSRLENKDSFSTAVNDNSSENSIDIPLDTNTSSEVKEIDSDLRVHDEAPKVRDDVKSPLLRSNTAETVLCLSNLLQTLTEVKDTLQSMGNENFPTDVPGHLKPLLAKINFKARRERRRANVGGLDTSRKDQDPNYTPNLELFVTNNNHLATTSSASLLNRTPSDLENELLYYTSEDNEFGIGFAYFSDLNNLEQSSSELLASTPQKNGLERGQRGPIARQKPTSLTANANLDEVDHDESDQEPENDNDEQDIEAETPPPSPTLHQTLIEDNPESASSFKKKVSMKEKRKLRKERKLQKYFANSKIGNVVFFGHKNWNLVVNVMKGIQMAASRVAVEPYRQVSVFDFSVKEKYTLISQKTQVPDELHYNKYKHLVDHDTKSARFIDYAPYIFRRLRESFGIKDEEYIESVGPGNMITNLMLGSLSSLSEAGSEGKSGSFFYITPDGKYLIKTVHREEHKIFRRILPQYFYHMSTCGQDQDATSNGSSGIVNDNPQCKQHTFLTWILGCHIIRIEKHSVFKDEKIYLVVMNNVLNTELKLDYRFDLKGSTSGRKYSDEIRKQHKVTLKDLDFTELGFKINVGSHKRAQILSALKRDTSFLDKMGLIDYSLLVGIHRVAEESKHGEEALERAEDKQLIIKYHREASLDRLVSADAKEVYFLGLLDFLTPYSNRKRAEKVLRTIQTLDPDGISVQPPHKYAKRFMNFIEKIIE